MNTNEMEKLQPLFNRITQILQKTHKSIPPKFLQKIELLHKCLLDPTMEPNSLDYDYLTFDELNSLSKLNKESKIELIISLSNIFFKQKKVVGEIDILGRSSIIWSRKTIEIDLDLKELTIPRQNAKDQPYVIDLTDYVINYRGFLRGRYQYELVSQIINSQLKELIFGSENKEEITKWMEYFQNCCASDNIERSKTIHSNNQSEIIINEQESRERFRTAIVKKKEVDDTSITKSTLTPITKSIPEQTPVVIEEPIIQNELPVIFQDLQNKINMEYLQDDQEFLLISFENCARILQSKKNKNNFRVYVSLPKTSFEILITSLYDTNSQKKWNKQIRQSQIVLQATPFLAQVEEIREPLSFVYQPRKFKFLRYIYPQKDSFYIIEKSIEQNNNDAQLVWTIIGIFLQDLKCKIMVVDTLVYNNGYITKFQDEHLILNYISQYQNFKQYLKEENRKQELGSINLPIFVSEAMLLIKKYQQQNIKKSGSHSLQKQLSSDLTVSPNLIQQQNQTQINDQFSLDGGDSQQDQQIFLEDIRPEYVKQKAIIRNDNFNISSELNSKDKFKQSLLNQLQQVLDSFHHLSQIHLYQLKPQSNIQLEKFSKTSDEKHFFYQSDWSYDYKQGYLKFINQDKLQSQKKVFYYILQKIGQSLLTTQIINISLPVHIFERRSNLQRFAISFSYAPHFFEPVVNSSPLDQIKAVLAFTVSMNIMYLSLEKPFNPILGETFQCWIKGCPVYLEQISHHPPIAAFIMYGHGYKFYGHYETQASMGINTIAGCNLGRINIEFQNGSKLEFNNCKGYLSGITVGERVFYLQGPIYCIDYVNEYLGELYFNPSTGLFGKKSPLDYFIGSIYKIDEKEVSRWKKLGYKKYTGLRGITQKYPLLSQIDGYWQQEGKNFNVDERNVFNIMTDFPFQVYPEQFPLASDSQYRIDLLAWQLNDFDLTMKNKEILEKIQRQDRKLRQKK